MRIEYSRAAVKVIERQDAKTKQRIKTAIELIPEGDIKPFDRDDVATADDRAAHETAMREYLAGETISHDSINWD